MREILFRGKAEDGNWHEGWFCGQTCHTIFAPAEECAQIIRKDDLLWAEVIPETVGQYTGLRDKNGKKIFEGDILQFSSRVDGRTIKWLCEVKWCDGYWGIQEKGYEPDLLDSTSASGATLYGNIYDSIADIIGDLCNEKKDVQER